MIAAMPYSKYNVETVLAANLNKAMGAHVELNSNLALGKRSGVAATSIGYMRNPKTRAPTKSGKMASPTLSNIEKVARALGMQAWQLIYPEPDNLPISQREREIQAMIAENFKELHEIAAEKPASYARRRSLHKP